MQLPQQWIENLKILDIAFQPIINMHTGKLFAVEALLRNFQEVGFESIFDLFDKVYEDNILYTFDLALREKTIRKFTSIGHYKKIKLFYNLDNRLFEMPDFSHGNTTQILKDCNIKKDNICFEISERHELSGECNMEKIIRHYQDENFCIAIDDFGVGYSGFKLLYETTPNIIKVDRFFLTDIEKDFKKRLIVKNIVSIAVQLGINVIAEGIETKAELLTCKDIGCNLAQGYLIKKPTLHTADITKEYEHIQYIIQNDKRMEKSEYQIEAYLDKEEPIHFKSKMNSVIEYFQKNEKTTALPVINSINEPVGILLESEIKSYLYSPYGRALLLNESASKSKLKSLIRNCGVADIGSTLSTLIELFSNNPDSVGLIITKDSQYYGFLSARAIISIMNEQNIKLALEQNPLTKLPGNTMIEKYIGEVTQSTHSYMLCYFDLDNFKAFNDVYGFRSGDRVILLFAALMKKYLIYPYFNAHIGGDDFFTAIKYKNENQNENIYIEKISSIIKKFTQDARAFYSLEDQQKGYITAKDRDNNTKNFPLLTVSASLLIVSRTVKNRSASEINSILSLQKKVAKNSENNTAMSSLLESLIMV